MNRETQRDTHRLPVPEGGYVRQGIEDWYLSLLAYPELRPAADAWIVRARQQEHAAATLARW